MHPGQQLCHPTDRPNRISVLVLLKAQDVLAVFPYLCLHVESHTNAATALRGRDWGQLSCDDEGWVNAKDCVK